jgi:hypothetical protein
MAKFLQRVTAISRDGSDKETLYKKKKKKKKKTSLWLRPMERRQRRTAKALKTFGDTLLTRHNKSRRKRRNGWLRDGGLNSMRASRKAARKLLNI